MCAISKKAFWKNCPVLFRGQGMPASGQSSSASVHLLGICSFRRSERSKALRRGRHKRTGADPAQQCCRSPGSADSCRLTAKARSAWPAHVPGRRAGLPWDSRQLCPAASGASEFPFPGAEGVFAQPWPQRCRCPECPMGMSHALSCAACGLGHRQAPGPGARVWHGVHDGAGKVLAASETS